MIIHDNFVGGNIKILKVDENDVYLEVDLRDTKRDWFYWAFCVEGVGEREVTFHFKEHRLGYFGPAVSHDLKKWVWLDSNDTNSFTYKFNSSNEKIYFAHSLLYHPKRFEEFVSSKGIDILEFAKSKNKQSIPYIMFGDGQLILLTARHHSCESTGSFVLEGVIDELISNPISGYKFVVVPFVDYDGVVDGDQGKDRYPHDHNRDYDINMNPIYQTTCRLREIIDENNVVCAFDFHSPYHFGGRNDFPFIVENDKTKIDKYNKFGLILEELTKKDAFKFEHKNSIEPDVGWNLSSNTSFSRYVNLKPYCDIAFSLETPYFGTSKNKVTNENLVYFGKKFAKALKEYLK